MAIVEDGDPHGAPVVVHHGTPGCGRLHGPWAADARERGLRLIGYDRAGYGASDRRAGRDVAAVAADLAAVADALGIARFATWGASGGGPHALACAALLGDRIVAAATFAGAGPHGEPDLDFMDGMGEDNLAEFGAALEGEAALRPLLDDCARSVRRTSAEELAEQMRSLLSPPDAAATTGELAEYLHGSFLTATQRGVDGWLDDDLAFTRPWGFDVGAIAVPVQVWQGDQDLMVPAAHGEWYARHIPGADLRRSPDDGHLTVVENHLGEVHAWLSGHF